MVAYLGVEFSDLKIAIHCEDGRLRLLFTGGFALRKGVILLSMRSKSSMPLEWIVSSKVFGHADEGRRLFYMPGSNS